MPRKSATEVKIDFLVKEVKELKHETTSLREDINNLKKLTGMSFDKWKNY